MTDKDYKLIHLLACLGEECGEVQQMVGKAIRFGINTPYRKDPEERTYRQLIIEEMHDVLAMYREVLILSGDPYSSDYKADQAKIEAKVSKVNRYFEQEGA